MRRRTTTGSLGVLIVLALTVSARAQKTIAVHLDPATTHINWTLGCNVHTVHGTFKLKSGDLTIDPATGDASGSIVIDAGSGESADPSRDKRMQSVVLESLKYPAITLRPTHVDAKLDLAAGGTVPVSGLFNLHGQDHPIQIAIALKPQGSAVAFSTQFVVPYVAWGLKDPSVLLFRCEKQVTIDVDATAQPQPVSH
jgi:polyisoprenoid-binding protein YceI